MRPAILTLSTVLLAGCATMDPGGSTLGTASLIGPDGGSRGSATLLARGSDRVMQVRLNGLTPGEHGLHLHAVGQCATPDFQSAGSHWSPTGAQHGSLNPQGPHAGDLGNVRADAQGRVDATVALPRGDDGLFDADGAAILVHSGRDDLRTDPSGDSGERVACGVLRPARASL